MFTTTQIIDLAKENGGIASDYALAKRLEITKGAMSKYRNGLRSLDDDIALKIAPIAGINEVELLAHLHAEKAKSKQARTVWVQMAKLAKKAQAGAVKLSAVLAVLPAAPLLLQAFQRFETAAHCILC